MTDPLPPRKTTWVEIPHSFQVEPPTPNPIQIQQPLFPKYSSDLQDVLTHAQETLRRNSIDFSDSWANNALMASTSPKVISAQPSSASATSHSLSSASSSPISRIQKPLSPSVSVLDIQPHQLATHWSVMSAREFANIPRQELASLKWIKNLKSRECDAVRKGIEWFNRISLLTSDTILSHQTAKARSTQITYFINILSKLLELNDFNTIFAINSSLQSASIWRLEASWSLLPKKVSQQYKIITSLLSNNSNFCEYRTRLKSMRETQSKCVPYLGLFLTDLTYLDAKSDDSSKSIYSLLDEFQAFQNAARGFGLIADEMVESVFWSQTEVYVMETGYLYEEELWRRSLALEPKILSTQPKASEFSQAHGSGLHPLTSNTSNLSNAGIDLLSDDFSTVDLSSDRVVSQRGSKDEYKKERKAFTIPAKGKGREAFALFLGLGQHKRTQSFNDPLDNE